MLAGRLFQILGADTANARDAEAKLTNITTANEYSIYYSLAVLCILTNIRNNRKTEYKN